MSSGDAAGTKTQVWAEGRIAERIGGSSSGRASVKQHIRRAIVNRRSTVGDQILNEQTKRYHAMTLKEDRISLSAISNAEVRVQDR